MSLLLLEVSAYGIWFVSSTVLLQIVNDIESWRANCARVARDCFQDLSQLLEGHKAALDMSLSLPVTPT